MRFIGPDELRAFDAAALDGLLLESGMVVAAGDGRVGGPAAAALLFADYAVLQQSAVLGLDVPEAWAAAVWRIGRRVMPLVLDGNRDLPAEEAVRAGLCDETIDVEPAGWLASWTRNRSMAALETAAVLLRRSGGDRLEAAAFARLFAIGDPREGLAAFLERRTPRFDG